MEWDDLQHYELTMMKSIMVNIFLITLNTAGSWVITSARKSYAFQLIRSKQPILSRRQCVHLFSVINVCSAADGRTSGISWRPSFIAKKVATALGIALFRGKLNGDINCLRGICINSDSIDP